MATELTETEWRALMWCTYLGVLRADVQRGADRLGITPGEMVTALTGLLRKRVVDLRLHPMPGVEVTWRPDGAGRPQFDAGYEDLKRDVRALLHGYGVDDCDHISVDDLGGMVGAILDSFFHSRLASRNLMLAYEDFCQRTAPEESE